MTLDQLRYFREAAKFQHVGKAARSVRISPSAISAAIAALEMELGCRLFERRHKAILLTDAGRRLAGESEQIFDQVAGLTEAMRSGIQELRGHYRMGGSHFLASHLLTREWSALQAVHAALDGEIRSLATHHVLREVLEGTLDAGLCFSPFAHPDLQQRVLHRGPLVVATRREHPALLLSGRKALERLAEYPAAIHKGQPGVDLCEAHPIFERYGIAPKIRFSFDNDACAIERVMNSDSWTMVPEVVARTHARSLQTIRLPVDWDATYFIALVYRAERNRNPVIRALGDRLEAAFAARRDQRRNQRRAKPAGKNRASA